jgi:hypothetical protein
MGPAWCSGIRFAAEDTPLVFGGPFDLLATQFQLWARGEKWLWGKNQ